MIEIDGNEMQAIEGGNACGDVKITNGMDTPDSPTHHSRGARRRVA